MDISFYHLTNLGLEKSLPQLIEKMIKAQLKISIYAYNSDLEQNLDILLWSYSTRKFIPHGTHNDNYVSRQPVIINNTTDNLNNADILIDLSLEKFDLDKLKYSKLIHIFSNLQVEEVSKARELYKSYSNLGKNIIYYKQKATGEWEKSEK